MTSTLSPAAYAEHVRASERTVRRWLADGELPAAEQVGGRWEIPADAVRVQRLPEVGAVERATTAAVVSRPHRVQPAATLSGALEALPVYLDVATAAQLLGVSEHAVRQNAAALGARRWGPHGSLVIPQAALRERAGL